MRVHAFGDDALGDGDAVDLAGRVRRREVSGAELRAAVASRLDQVDPVLRGVGDDYRDAPVFGDVDGLLTGVPSLIKANVDVAGWPTRNGSQAYLPAPSLRHGAVARQVLASGLDLMGTTRMPEFGLNATTEFVHDEPARNPWNSDFSSGGSSGGAAALVAAGAVPLAHGNDGGGSIRVPAAACGLIGLKPSRGRTAASENGRRMPIDIQSDAVLSRSVRDTATFLAAVDRHRPDRSLSPLGLVQGPAPRRLRIGLAVELPPGSSVDAPVDSVTKQALESTARLLEGLGHDVVASDLGFDAQFVADFLEYWAVLALGVGVGGGALFGSSFRFADLDPFTRRLVRRGRRRLLRVPGVLRRLRRAGARYRGMFADVDVLLTPVVGHPAPRIGWLGPAGDTEEVVHRLIRYAAYTPIANIAGTPSISLPIACTAVGVPVGIQLCGARGDERTLIELAYALELVSGWSGIS